MEVCSCFFFPSPSNSDWAFSSRACSCELICLVLTILPALDHHSGWANLVIQSELTTADGVKQYSLSSLCHRWPVIYCYFSLQLAVFVFLTFASASSGLPCVVRCLTRFTLYPLFPKNNKPMCFPSTNARLHKTNSLFSPQDR